MTFLFTISVFKHFEEFWMKLIYLDETYCMLDDNWIKEIDENILHYHSYYIQISLVANLVIYVSYKYEKLQK